MAGRHAVEHGHPSWSELQQQNDLDLPESVINGLAAGRPPDLYDGYPSAPSHRRPAPYRLSVGQFVTWMRATHQVLSGRVCKCAVEGCAYLEAIMSTDPNDSYQVDRFMSWMYACHQHMTNGCSCDIDGCEYRKRLDWIDTTGAAQRF